MDTSADNGGSLDAREQPIWHFPLADVLTSQILPPSPSSSSARSGPTAVPGASANRSSLTSERRTIPTATDSTTVTPKPIPSAECPSARQGYGALHTSSTALIILNVPIPSVRLLSLLWKKSRVRVCADGGANHVFRLLSSCVNNNDNSDCGHDGKMKRKRTKTEAEDEKGSGEARRACEGLDVDSFLPDCIIGDLDSLESSVRAYYESRNVPVIDLSADQDSTDFGKALKWVRGEYPPGVGATATEKGTAPRTGENGLLGEADSPSFSSATLSLASSPDLRGASNSNGATLADQSVDTSESTQAHDNCNGFRDIVVIGGFTGRLDQTYSQIHQVYSETFLHPARRVWIVGEGNLTFVLRKGENVIEIGKRRIKLAVEKRRHCHDGSACGHDKVEDSSAQVQVAKHTATGGSGIIFSPNVGILPFFGPATISTAGLEWDVRDWRSEIGGRVSTSNHVLADVIRVWTDRPVLFTIEWVDELAD